MTREERENALHCLKVMIGEEVCEECNLYGSTGTDHCEADCVRTAIKALEQEPCETIKEIPKNYKYDTETKDFLVYRHMYTGHEIHIEKPVPRYRLEQQPCEDCISREQAIKQCGFGMTSLLIADNLRKLPSVQPKPKTGHWISVSERMPDEFAVVLCNTDSEEIFIATYLGKMNDGTDCFDDANGMMCEGDVIAWMPLPEPYRPESEK